MLPTAGYFSGIPCVFFSDGGCSRPHCHYWHSFHAVVSDGVGQKTQDAGPTLPDNFSSESSGLDTGRWSPTKVTRVTKMVENAVDKALRSDPIPSTLSRSVLVKNTLDQLLADPEALEMASRRNPTCEVVPAYNPTLISELSTTHIPIPFMQEIPHSRAHENRASKHHDPILISHIMSSKTKPTENTIDLALTSSHSMDECFPILNNSPPQILTNSPESDSEKLGFHRDIIQGFHRTDSETELAEGSQHTAHVTKSCKVFLKRLLESKSRSSGVPTKGKIKSSKKSIVNTNSSSIRNLKRFGTEFRKAPSEHKIQVIPQFEVRKTSVADTEAAARGMSSKPVEKSDVQSCEPPAKKKNSISGPITLQVSSSVDPFSRWLKNKKIRQILGKDKILKDSRANPNSVKPQVQKRCHDEIPPKKVSPLEEELPEPKMSTGIAHQQDKIRPVPITAEDIKIPSEARQHFCAAFFEEFKKSMNLYEARTKAAEEELQVAKNSKTVKTYRNHCSLLIVKYRKGNIENVKLKPEDFTPSSCPEFTYGWSLYKAFSSYLLSENELKENGFPLAVPQKPIRGFVDKSSRSYSIQQPGKAYHKICANCCVEFQIDEIGFPTTVDDCFYHWGKLKKVQCQGQMVEKFTCCGGSVDSAPCELSVYHVWSGRDEDCVEDFVETTKLPLYMEDHDAGIYALDCEMCYTTKGLELARLTVLDLNGHAVFDEVISLSNPILNYSTRFSGIDARKMASATQTFDDVRNWILDHFYDKTILIGHSLENDLKALKLIHRTIVDTSVTFPHKFGPPNKMSLKHLANVVLELNIQETTDGHDSKEDAATCLKLMMKKIQEDSKARKPRVIIGYNGKKK